MSIGLRIRVYETLRAAFNFNFVSFMGTYEYACKQLRLCTNAYEYISVQVHMQVHYTASPYANFFNASCNHQIMHI